MIPPVSKGQVYKHFNNNFFYEVLCIAREEDLGIDMVVHKGLHDNRIWVRSMENFTSEKNNKQRFQLISL